MAMSVGMLQLGHGLGEFCHSIPYPISMFGNSLLAFFAPENHSAKDIAAFHVTGTFGISLFDIDGAECNVVPLHSC